MPTRTWGDVMEKSFDSFAEQSKRGEEAGGVVAEGGFFAGGALDAEDVHAIFDGVKAGDDEGGGGAVGALVAGVGAEGDGFVVEGFGGTGERGDGVGEELVDGDAGVGFVGVDGVEETFVEGQGEVVTE